MRCDIASVCDMKTAHMCLAQRAIYHVFLFEYSLSSCVKTTLLFINASQHSVDEAD